jgi:thioredoxin 1
MAVADIQADDWETQVAQSNKPVIVEYWHHKCPSCIEMKPIFEAQPEKLGESAKLLRMNLLESKENRVFAIRNGIRSTPTFVVYCGGRPTGQIIGQRKPDDFTDELKMILDKTEYCLKSTPIEE